MINSNILKTSIGIAALVLIIFGFKVFNPDKESNSNTENVQLNTKIFTDTASIVEDVEANNNKSKTTFTLNAKSVEAKRYLSRNKTGFIGYFDDKPLDNPIDNVFHVQIDRKLNGNETVWLEYELYGVEDYTGIAHSVNDQLAVGGYIVKKSNKWKKQREQLNPSDLKNGDNVVRFTLPENADYGFQIKNLSIFVEPYTEMAINNPKPDRRLVVNQPTSEYYYGNLGYLQGYVIGDNKNKAEILIDGERIRYNQGTFESLVKKNTANENWTVSVQAVFDDGQLLRVEVPFNKPSEWDEKNGFDKNIHHTEHIATVKDGFDIQLANAHLTGEAGSVEKNTNISITALRVRDIPALDAGMVNVTAGYAGYRFLPHGTEFKKDIAVNLGYDTTKIPNGYGEKDIQTYFFDEVSHHWIAIPRDSVLLASNITQSRTNHFSDYINAIIKVPESPETQGYTPTSMKDVKAANPATGINMIQPPTANSMGNANLNYPINIPAGRQGMQPQLAISYNSGGGNGWLGLGWDLSVPSISVETRWGVPHYDPDYESETYLMMGEQLSPLAHRSDWVKRDKKLDKKQFYPRVEGSFNKIIRKGTTPKDYHWVVTDKSGVKYFYGGVDGADENAILRIENGNIQSPIAHWVLVKVEDLNGNFVKYNYAKVEDVGVVSGTVPGYQIYLESIEYTGFGEDKGAYSVYFTRDRELSGFEELKRKDITINARYGFKQVTADRLKKVEVRFQTELIRSYDLHYSDGAFNKTLLDSIVENDASGTRFTAHSFNYFDEVRNNEKNYVPFKRQKNLTVEYDEVGGYDLMSWAKANATGGSKSKSWGAGSYVGVGWDNNIFSKANSGGFDYDYNQSVNEGLVALVDIDGDGLSDRVFVKGNRLKYRRKLPENPETFANIDTYVGGNISSFQYSKSRSNKFGLGIYPGQSYVGGSKSYTTTETSAYFTDANGDGLMDIVVDETVYFNRIIGGIPHFDASTVGTPNEISNTAQVSSELDFSTLTSNEVIELKQKNPLQDAVRIWIAPFSGIIDIKAPVKLIYNPDSEAKDPDGIVVSIQKNSSSLWTEEIDEGNYSVIEPEANNVNGVSVLQGDKILFRVHSVDNGFDDMVVWNPEITYKNKDLTVFDANLKPYFYYNAQEDYLLANHYTLAPPIDGLVNIEGEFKKPPTTDDIDVRIVKYNENKEVVETLWVSHYPWNCDTIQPIDLPDIIVYKTDEIGFEVSSTSNVDWNKIEWIPYMYYTQSYDPDVDLVEYEGTYFINSNPIVHKTVYPKIERMGQIYKVPDFTDTLTVQLRINKETTPSGTFTFIGTEVEGDTLGVKSFEIDKGIFVSDSILKFACRSGMKVNFSFTELDGVSPSEINDSIFISSDNELYDQKSHFLSDVFIYTPTVSITAIGGVIKDNNPFAPQDIEGSVWLTAKQPESFSAKKKITYHSGIDTLTFEAVAGHDLYLEFNVQDRHLLKYLKENIHINHRGTNDSIIAFVHSVAEEEDYQLGNLYRGWGQFGYNGNDGRGDSPININDLNIKNDFKVEGDSKDVYKVDQSSIEGSANMDELEGNFESGNGYNASTAKFILMRPDFSTGRWVGYDESVFVSLDTINSSRMGEKEITAESYKPSAGGNFFAPIKKNKSSTLAANGNVFGLGGSLSSTESRMLSDYMDLNGDRYPDIITGGKVQYTKPTGGLSDLIKGIGNVSESEGKSDGLTVGSGFMEQVVNKVSKGHDLNLMGNMSIGVSVSNSTNDDKFNFIDINGDGLADKVYKNGQVSLNYGYSFGTLENWSFSGIQKSKLESKQGNAGIGGVGLTVNLETGAVEGGSVQFRTKTGSFVAGAGLYSSKSSPELILSDVNSDGLPDRLVQSGSTVNVYLNNGNGFETKPIPWLGIDKINESVSLNGSFNAAATFGFSPFVFPFKVVFNPRVNHASSVTRDERKLTDYDGDGFLDYVVSHDKGQVKFSRSTIGKTNLLRAVKRPLKSTFEIDYSQVGNTYDMPQKQWVLSKVKIFDGFSGTDNYDDGEDFLQTVFEYSGGKQDRFERAFYGFANVTTTQLNENEDPYRSTIQTFDTSSYHTKGLLLSELMQDAKGKRYTEKINEYKVKSVKPSLEYAAFPALDNTTKNFYEGKSEVQKSTKVSFVYDSYGNVTEYNDYGDEGDTDNLKATIGYHNSVDTDSKYLVGIPASIKVYGGGSSDVLRERSTDIYDETGKIKQIVQKTGDKDAVYDLFYDDYGNLDSIIRPENHKGERMYFAYTYDEVLHSLVTSVRDAYGYSSSSAYNYKFGQLKSTTDLNGNETKYEIDSLGRITKITGPYELESGQDYTIRFAYYPFADVPWAQTQHYDPEHPDNPIETAIFIDGLGRVMQTKKDGAIFEEKGKEDQEVMIVSGLVKYDAFGRSEMSWYPVSEEKSTFTAMSNFNYSVNDEAEPTTIAYDVLDRTISTVLPDGAETKTLFGIGEDRDGNKQFMTRVTDANEKITESFTDIKGRLTAVKAPGETWTSFVYNAISELIEVKDAEDNVTKSEYDLLGRRLKRIHPDAGTTTYAFDAAGNMIEQLTANLDSADLEPIMYEYEFNRLVNITYPENTINNVHFEYGQADAEHNRAGRIVLQEDATGAQEFYYGSLGEITKNIRSVIVPDEGVFTFETEWEYDTWNRLKKMVYPDGEEVTYNYNLGGLLQEMYGKKKGTRYDYITQLGYDKFEDREYIGFGNGTETYYKYEDDRRRLKHILTSASTGRSLMDNTYTYDDVNNITNLKSNAPIPETGFKGGRFDYNFEYDDLYRLTVANGLFEGAESEHRYELAMEYSPTGRILYKDQLHQSRDRGESVWGTRGKTTYTFEYKYEGKKPHAPSQIGDNAFTYDANGNATGWQRMIDGGGKSQRRDILWDEENRIRAIAENGSTHHYIYDASGERVIKATGDGQAIYINGFPMGGSGTVGNYTMYVNPYMVVNNMNFTKHFYIEGQRVVTKLGEGGAYQYLLNDKNTQYVAGGDTINYDKKMLQQKESIMENFEGLGLDGVVFTAGKSGKTPYGQIKKYYRQQNGDGATHVKDTTKATANTNEKFRYFYHPDHLGSSSYITDASGEVYQHFEYFPFGETFYESRHDHHRTPYLFNGKELDKETGLYYYGARYYDAKISMFYGVDPHAENYNAWSPYHYSANNPIRITDPTGMDWYDVNGTITWHDQEGDLTIKDQTYQSLGKNVLVGTHNRDENGNEEINSATFDLYLESNKEGPSATISGNTVPADTEKYGTMAEGLYSAVSASRASYVERNEEDLALLINGGGEIPTINGNPNKSNSDMLTGIFFHAGNPFAESLKDSGGNPVWSHGCQTSGSGKGSRAKHNDFMNTVGNNFKGNYYLRASPTYNGGVLPSVKIMGKGSSYLKPLPAYVNF